jgi:hypothetical protein
MADEAHDPAGGPSDDGPHDDAPGVLHAERVARAWDRLRSPGVPEQVDAPTALSRRLHDTPSGPDLARLLLTLELDELDAYDRVEVVAAARRLESWAHAVTAQAAAAVDRHPRMRAPVLPPRTGRALTHQHISTATLAMRLHASPREVAGLIQTGLAITGDLADTGTALAAGVVDVPRTRAIVRRLHDQVPEVALAVEAAVLPRAETRTAYQVRKDVEAELQRVDGEHAVERHAHARGTRSVSRPRVLDDGMAGVWAVLPAEDAVRIDAALEAAARTARAAGDPRTLAQLRADGLRDLVLHSACEPRTPLGLAADGDAVAAADPDAGSTPPAPPVPPHPRTRVHVTIPLSTLMGIDDGPADLAGYGPIDAVQARALAWGGTWRRLVTDPVEHTVLNLGRTRYRPTAALAEHVRARDRVCAWPGCALSAELADLDHSTSAHPPPGTVVDPAGLGETSDANLEPLCRHHHRLKTEAGFVLRHVRPGVFEWTAPSGHRYRVRPGVADETIRLPAEEPPF